MAKEDNLTPFPKGVSGNPNGRPKGALNSKTRIKRYLEELDDSGVTNWDKMILAIIQKAQKGDVYAFDKLLDRIEGKAIAHIDANISQPTVAKLEIIKASEDSSK